jgi:CBS domain-containing protein
MVEPVEGFRMLVRDVLRTKGRRLFVTSPEATVREAVNLLVEHNIGSLPVVDGEGRCIGMFTERDVLCGVAGDCESYGRATVGEVMTPDPCCCGLLDEIHEVMGKMSDRRVGQLPVLDDEGRVTAVVSVGDLVRVLYESAQAENQQLYAYIYGGS